METLSTRGPVHQKPAGVLAAVALFVIASLPGRSQGPLDASPSQPAQPVVAALQHVDAHAQVQPAANDVTYWFGANYRTPFVTDTNSGKVANIERNSVEFTHLSFWSKGSQFADVLMNHSNRAEPEADGNSGATEVYATLRSALGLNEITNSGAFHKGPLRDISMELGANLETKNSAFAPAERTLYFGPKLQVALPKGYLDVGLHLRKEWNYEGILGKAEDYNVDFNIEPAWLVPFRAGRVSMTYSGFADYNTAKGRDSFGNETAPEFLVRNYAAFDLGGLLMHRPQTVDVNCGFWYWHNEYGKPASDPGAQQMTPIFGLTVHMQGLRSGQGH